MTDSVHSSVKTRFGRWHRSILSRLRFACWSSSCNRQVFLYPAMNLMAVALVLYSYFSSRDRAERRRLRWTLFGGGVSIVWFAVTVNLPRLLDMPMQVNPWIAAAGYFAAPLGIAIGLI